MATEQVKLLSESHLKQALIQIRQIPTFSGNSQEVSAFFRRIEFILQLYPSTDTSMYSSAQLRCNLQEMLNEYPSYPEQQPGQP